jgi:FKBP-type peptidyl-prolyl cis-trans isomerase FklB
MKKSILWVIGLLFSASLVVTSCDETDGAVDPYFNWVERNQLYIDSIAKVAQANPEQWRMIHTYKFDAPMGDLSFDTNDYVYCKVLEKGTGTVRPVYTDSVSTHYRGQLIPLYNGSTVVFDQSYKGELNTDFAQPVTFSVQGVIEGWTTALQHMVEGDRWEVYIPSRLGYGQAAMDAIPTNSTLIFDMQLVKVITSR